jgi:hypothetical protein
MKNNGVGEPEVNIKCQEKKMEPVVRLLKKRDKGS